MYKAGELIYDASPLKKGANLSHGTAGNCFAFLKLYDVTGNSICLECAQLFAMNAIEQSERKSRHTI